MVYRQDGAKMTVLVPKGRDGRGRTRLPTILPGPVGVCHTERAAAATAAMAETGSVQPDSLPSAALDWVLA